MITKKLHTPSELVVHTSLRSKAPRARLGGVCFSSDVISFFTHEGDRTRNTQIDNLVLSPIELPGRERWKGFNYSWLVFIGIVLFSFNSYASIDLNAIAQIESSGCKSPCVGDSGKALGSFQLHYPLIQDFNRWNGTSYTHKDALNPITARLIASWAFDTYYPKILRRLKLEPTTDRLIACFNAGCGALKRKSLPLTTQKYLKKYKEITK